MRKILAVVSLAVLVLAGVSCGDAGDNSITYKWKDVHYAFDMEEKPIKLEEQLNVLRGLHAEITYLDPLTIERRYDYSGFEQWDTVFTHLPWGFIPRMKATLYKPDDVVYTESDFPAVVSIKIGVSNGDNTPQRLEKDEKFETLSQFNKYITDKEKCTYAVFPSSTDVDY